MIRLPLIAFIAFVLAACAHTPTAPVALLDQAVHGATEKEVFVRLYAIKEKLPPGDQGIYEEAFSALTSEFRSKVCEGLTEEEKSRAFVAAFDGITPRQVILLGMALHTEICQQPDDYEDTLQGDEKKWRHEHMQEHLVMLKNETTAALKKYGKPEANKPLQGTEGKAPSSSTEPEDLRP